TSRLRALEHAMLANMKRFLSLRSIRPTGAAPPRRGVTPGERFRSSRFGSELVAEVLADRQHLDLFALGVDDPDLDLEAPQRHRVRRRVRRIDRLVERRTERMGGARADWLAGRRVHAGRGGVAIVSRPGIPDPAEPDDGRVIVADVRIE